MIGQSGVGFMESVRDSGVFRCLECGKCTAVCPISRHDRGFSPRRTVGRAVMSRDDALLTDDRLWACVTCLRCTQVCPAAVSYADLTLTVRAEAHRQGRAAVCTHGEALHSWMRMMGEPDLKQNRLGWLEDDADDLLDPTVETDVADESPDATVETDGSGGAPDVTVEPDVADESPEATALIDAEPLAPLRVSEDGSTLYFVGCAPYFHVQFGHIGVDGHEVARSTVRALNALGIEPQVLADERCCGHDLLWEGDVDGFASLARINADLIRESGAERIVTACPECARALKLDYPAHGVDLGVEILHLSQLVADELTRADEGGADVGAPAATSHRTGRGDPEIDANGGLADGTVTYHDPCRLGRHLGVYDAPRTAMSELGIPIVEMRRSRESAECCGTNGWTHCGAANKAIQSDRLREAQATGAGTLVTACLKCQIHFRCALQDRQLGAETHIEIRDLSTMLAEELSRNGPRPQGD